jgi:predicted DCC family thiol-disulfide oxidoreductase YuxK
MERPTIIYDSDCGFCRWAIRRILAWDRTRRIRPVALQSDEAADLLSHLSERERFASWHLVATDGSIHSGGRGVAPLLRSLPGGRAPAAVAAWSPRTVDRAYGWVARHRQVLGRIVGARACAIEPRPTSQDD